MNDETRNDGQQPEREQPPGDERERQLLEQVNDEDADPVDSRWQLAWHYSSTGRTALAIACYEDILRRSEDPEHSGATRVAMGVAMERTGRFEEAVGHYQAALEFEIADQDMSYFRSNNLGYSLNQLGRFEEAEQHCTDAIFMAPERHNAYKNYGVAVEGQGRHEEAVRAYVAAAMINPADRRAVAHLRELFARHPEVAIDDPDIREKVVETRKIMDFFADFRRSAMRHRPDEDDAGD